MSVPPQVIRRGDSYVVHNVDVTGLTVVQKLALAVEVWPQVRDLMQASGEYKPPDRQNFRGIGAKGHIGVGSVEDIDRATAKAVGCAPSPLNTLRPRLLERPDILERMKNGEFPTYKGVGRELGMKFTTTLAEGRPSGAKRKNSYYGKGDKFDEASEPLVRYLQAWEKKGFLFTHVPPKEAKRRLAKLEEMMGGLEKIKEDILMRSHAATFKVRS